MQKQKLNIPTFWVILAWLVVLIGVLIGNQIYLNRLKAQPITKKPINVERITLKFIPTPFKAKFGLVSAYNTLASQTDTSPCISASGANICGLNGVVANNCLPYHTLIEIKGVKYEVLDRLNSRYGCDVYDISFDKDLQGAINFGKQQLAIKIY